MATRWPHAQPHEGAAAPTEASAAHRYSSTAPAVPLQLSSSAPQRFAPSPLSDSSHQSHLRPTQQQQHPLLVKRVYALEEYAHIFATRKKGQTKYVAGALPTPIPVPLRADETMREYEHQFVAWLQGRKMSLYDASRDPNHERSLRINFANIRAVQAKVTPTAQGGSTHGAVRTQPYASQLQNPQSPSGKRRNSFASGDVQPRKRSALERPEAEVHPSSVKEQRPPPSAASSETSGRTDSLSPPVSDPASKMNATTFEAVNCTTASSDRRWTQCTAVLPNSTASAHKFAAAYVACACRACLCDWNLMLTERLESLEHELRVVRNQLEQTTTIRSSFSKCASVKCEQQHIGNAVSDTSAAVKKEVNATPRAVTKETEPSGGIQDAPQSVKMAANDPVTTAHVMQISKSSSAPSSQSSSTLQDTAIVSSSPPSEAAPPEISPASGSLWPRRDPIRAQMLHEYNALNSEIILNEQVVNESLKLARATMRTDMASAMEALEQIEQIKASIRDEMANRDAALAVLIAYTWRSRPQELESRMDRYGTLDVAHVHRTSHEKCAMLASQIKDKQASVARVRVVLDTEVGAVSTDDAHIDKLSALGTQLVQAEQDVVALENEQWDEFMWLFQFSHSIRKLCGIVLANCRH